MRRHLLLVLYAALITAAPPGRAAVIAVKGSPVPVYQVTSISGAGGVKPETGLGSSFSGLDPSARIPVAVLRRRGWRRTVATPLRGLSWPTISQ